MSSQLTAPRPLYEWAQPTVATNWTADMLERLPDDGWHYELLEGRVLRIPLPSHRRGTSYGPLAPDLVVEIASPSHYQPEMGEKAQLWLERGVRLVWVVWPARRAIDIWTPGAAAPRTLHDGTYLAGDDVVPGFRLSLAELW